MRAPNESRADFRMHCKDMPHYAKPRFDFERQPLETRAISIKCLVLFIIGGMIYLCLEILWRGYTHISMGVVGGIAFVCIGCLNQGVLRGHWGIIIQSLIGAGVVTILEFASGCILNLWLGLNVWDYSHLWGNILGQICVPFTLLWIPVSALAIWLDDLCRCKIFKEPFPKYWL